MCGIVGYVGSGNATNFLIVCCFLFTMRHLSLLNYTFTIILLYRFLKNSTRFRDKPVSVKFSSVIHLTVDNYYLRGFGLISISV